MNWRKEIGASNGIKTIEKEEMIMSGIVMMGNPADPAHTRGGIIPGNHTDIGLGSTPKDHIDAETIPTQRGRIDEVILIPRNRAGEDTVHIRTDMLAEVRTFPRIKGHTT